MNLKEQGYNIFNQYSYNLTAITLESTERIFYLRKHQNNEFKTISLKNLSIGHFYLILYNFNGNKIFCPILPLEYKVWKNKNILYCINLDYLPYEYKIEFFGQLFYLYQSIIDKNIDISDVSSEMPLKGITFENIYKALKKNGGFEFSVTAFDVLKIEEVNIISTNIMDRFIFLNTRYVNSALMKELVEKTDSEGFKTKLKDIITEYDNIKLEYDEDTKAFYKKLKAFEKNYKLSENISK
jgi:hypothetical protein